MPTLNFRISSKCRYLPCSQAGGLETTDSWIGSICLTLGMLTGKKEETDFLLRSRSQKLPKVVGSGFAKSLEFVPSIPWAVTSSYSLCL